MANDKFYLSNIKKFLIKKGYTVYRKKTKPINRDARNLFFVFLSSFFLIFFFAALPKTVSYTSNILIKPEIVENNSKLNFEKVFEGKELELKPEEKKKVAFKDLFFDIFDFDDATSETVRLSASTLEELFKETKYNLKEIRKNKVVKPINIDLLPKEIKFIENSKKKKELFNFSAGGFKDFTRIGSSDPKMWTDIFLQNKNHILKTLDDFLSDLQTLKKNISNNNSTQIMNLLKKTKKIRKGILDVEKNFGRSK